MIMSQRHRGSLLCGGGNCNRTWRRAGLLSLAAAGVLLRTPGAASADDASWNVPSGAWETGTNWSTGNVPGSTDLAWIDNGGVATLSTFTGSVLGLQIGSATGKS